ncbi:MAG: hypothetical protein V1495_04550 [Pseudomonadota bacterium]
MAFSLIAILSLAACAELKKAEEDLNRLANSGMVPIAKTDQDSTTDATGSTGSSQGGGGDSSSNTGSNLVGADETFVVTIGKDDNKIAAESDNMIVTGDDNMIVIGTDGSFAAEGGFVPGGDNLVVISTDVPISPNHAVCHEFAEHAKASLYRLANGREMVIISVDKSVLTKIDGFGYLLRRNGLPVGSDCAAYQGANNCSELFYGLNPDRETAIRSIAPAFETSLSFENRLTRQPGDILEITPRYKLGTDCNPGPDPGDVSTQS